MRAKNPAKPAKSLVIAGRVPAPLHQAVHNLEKRFGIKAGAFVGKAIADYLPRYLRRNSSPSRRPVPTY